MSDNAAPPRRILPLLGYAVLLAWALLGIWMATAVILPSAWQILREYKLTLTEPFGFALRIQHFCYQAVYPTAFLGLMLLSVSSSHRGSARLIGFCEKALPVLTGFVVCLAIYLLGSGGVAYKFAYVGPAIEVMHYQRTLEKFALLEAAKGQFEQLRARFQEGNSELKMVEVHNVSEFSDAEARQRVNALITSLPKTDDIAAKRRLLATLCMFRNHLPDRFDTRATLFLNQAVEAGVPPSTSPTAASDWITANLHKDAWEPLPLFKIQG